MHWWKQCPKWKSYLGSKIIFPLLVFGAEMLGCTPSKNILILHTSQGAFDSYFFSWLYLVYCWNNLLGQAGSQPCCPPWRMFRVKWWCGWVCLQVHNPPDIDAFVHSSSLNPIIHLEVLLSQSSERSVIQSLLVSATSNPLSNSCSFLLLIGEAFLSHSCSGITSLWADHG